MRSEKEEEQRSDEIEQRAEAAEIIDDSREMHEALFPTQSGNSEWIGRSKERLKGALGPTGALLHELAAFICGHAGRERFVQIFNLVASGLELDRGGPILSDGFGRNAADL